MIERVKEVVRLIHQALSKNRADQGNGGSACQSVRTDIDDIEWTGSSTLKPAKYGRFKRQAARR